MADLAGAELKVSRLLVAAMIDLINARQALKLASREVEQRTHTVELLEGLLRDFEVVA